VFPTVLAGTQVTAHVGGQTAGFGDVAQRVADRLVVAVFQWGWGKELIGLETTVPIVSFIPMFMFAVLFGLSTDYEVFLLSRVREEYLATGDNDGAVVLGLARTARVITSAALIMIAAWRRRS
jgi:RND superfamily putative drug exporter